MKINKILIVLALATVYYVLWQIGFDYIWANVLKAGISTITATLAGIQQVTIDNTSPVPVLYFKYADRTNHINIEYALPIVLMLAWQTYLFIVKEVPRKFAIKSLIINILVIWIIQILFPLLLFNISASKIKGTFFFFGLQIFGMIVLFLIIKDTVMLKYRSETNTRNNN